MNKASFISRLGAYVIDIWIVFLLTSLIATFVTFNNEKLKSLNTELNDLTDQALSESVDLVTYTNEYARIVQEIDKNNAIYNVVNAFLIIGCFIIIPYFNDGKTIGKSLLKIKVVRNDKEYISLNDLVLRSFIVTGLGYMLLSLMLMYILPSMLYFLIVIILGIIQILLVILSVFMIIYRHDKRGLQDVIAHTSVVKV